MRVIMKLCASQQVDEAAAQDAAAAEGSQALSADVPLPLPYVVENEAKRPLPGVQSVFLTGDDMTCRHCSFSQTLMLCFAQALHSGWLGQQKRWQDRPELQHL